VADIVFGCGRYRLAIADIVAADMVCGRYGRTSAVGRVVTCAVFDRTVRFLSGMSG